MSHSLHKLCNVTVSSGGAGAAFTHTLRLVHPSRCMLLGTVCSWRVTRRVGANLNELCSRCRQSAERASLRRDSRKRWVCLRRDWLGGNRPQQSHSSCQPCSMLSLGDGQTTRYMFSMCFMLWVLVCIETHSCTETHGRVVIFHFHLWVNVEFLFFCTVCTSYCRNKEINTKE